MTPEEMAWAFQNAGRAPAAEARRTTSQEFAERARAQEDEALRRRQALLNAKAESRKHEYQGQPYPQSPWPQQTMAAARARASQQLGAMNTESPDWRQGFALGVAGGLLLGSILRSLFGKRR